MDPELEIAQAQAAKDLAGITAVPSILRTGIVTGVREDGFVNIKVDDGLSTKIPCADTYANRRVGDQVQLLLDNSRALVLCRVGQDTSYQGPEFSYTNRAVYTSTGIRTSGVYQQSCSNQGSDTDPRITVWSYWNGSSNTLTTNSAGGTTIKIFVSRLDDDTVGDRDFVRIQIQPHDYNALPLSGFAPLAGYQPQSAQLQVGAYALLTVPNAWKTAIQAGTIKGFCSQAQDLRAGVGYAVFSDTAGGYRID